VDDYHVNGSPLTLQPQGKLILNRGEDGPVTIPREQRARSRREHVLKRAAVSSTNRCTGLTAGDDQMWVSLQWARGIFYEWMEGGFA
jgi:hypothetical protein